MTEVLSLGRNPQDSDPIIQSFTAQPSFHLDHDVMAGAAIIELGHEALFVMERLALARRSRPR